MNIDTTIAFVSGANRGIGRAIVEALVARGAEKIYAAVRTIEKGAELSQALGDRVVPIELDFSREETFERAAEIASDANLVVNCAGILRTSPAVGAGAVDAMAEEVEINVLGLMRLGAAFGAVLEKNGGGVFVQLNSVASIKCFPGFATYSASKAATYSITQGLRAQWAAQETRVISVHPGPIATDMAETAGFAAQAEPPSVVADAILDALDSDDFHVFPDRAAKQLWSAYESYGKLAIEPLTPMG